MVETDHISEIPQITTVNSGVFRNLIKLQWE